MGGQVADKGIIKSNNFVADVTNVSKAPNGQHLHFVKVVNGSIKLNDTVTLNIDVARRNAIRKHHSAAHLLQSALKEVLGDHIAQAGSYVDDTKTRFDFNHFKKISSEELELIEKKVNDAILSGYPVVTEVMNIEDAKKTNAVALFDDKYQDLIRVVNMGDYSIEFCGGTHVSNTNDIGLFVIRSEESISSGVRRIEACCGIKGYELLKEREGLLKNVATSLKSASIYDVNEKLTATLNELNKQKTQITELKEKVASYELNALLNNVKVVDDVNVIINKVDNLSAGELNIIASGVKNKYPDHFLFIVSNSEDKLSMICQVSDKMINKGIFAGDIVKNASMLASGNGGGRKDFAQAGAKDVSKVDDIINYVNNIIGA
jgi:alanyl-tRNA synthetase